MSVGELIEKLQMMPANLEVKLETWDEFYSIEDVETTRHSGDQVVVISVEYL